MKYVVIQILGVALVVLGGQGAIRLLIDHGNTGLLGWLPGGFAGVLIGNVVLIALGVLLADRGRRRAKVHGR